MDIMIGKSNSELALHALLTESWHCFGHDDFHTFAMVNTLCRKAILDKADDRKKGFGKYIEEQEKLRPEFIRWNAYGSVCSTVSLEPTQRPSCILNQKCKNLFLRQYQLQKNKVVSCRKGQWSDFICCLPHNPLSIVTRAGDILFYGCGYELIPSQYSRVKTYIQGHPQIFQFSLSAEGKTGKTQCYASLGAHDSTDDRYTMINFLDFPVLLKTLLNSVKTMSQKVGLADAIKVYYLDGTLLPDDYQTWQKVRGRWNSFNQLPEYIKRPIIDHYNLRKGFEQENQALRSEQKLEVARNKEDQNAPVILLSGERKTEKTTEYSLSFVYDKIWYKGNHASIVYHIVHNTFWPKCINYRRNIVVNKDQEYQDWCNAVRDYGGVYFPEYETIVAGTQDIDTARVCINNVNEKS